MPAPTVDATASLVVHVAAFTSSCDAAAWCFPASLLSLPGPATATDNKQEYWSTELSSALYNVDGWGAPYFFVNDTGAIVMRPIHSFAGCVGVGLICQSNAKS
jgi:arginine decarboxylase